MTGRTHERLDLRPIPTSAEDFARALKIIRGAQAVDRLNDRLQTGQGRKRRDDLHAFLVACQANALRSVHTAEIVEITRVMNGFSPDQRAAVGLADWTIEDSYDRANRLFNDISNVEETTVVGRDVSVLECFHDQLAQAVVDASIAPPFRSSSAVAIDGTDIESWARLHIRRSQIPLDGEPGPSEEEAQERKNAPAVAKVLGIGPDGRVIYTKDPDARGGHRSATNSRRAGKYTGYEAHLVVQTREATIRDPVDRVKLGDAVPPLIRSFAITEAGAHRPRICRHLVDNGSSATWPIEDVIADRGMTQSVSEWQLPLRAAGKRPFFDLLQSQRGKKPTSRGPDVIDGWPISRCVPPRVLTNGSEHLQIAPRNSTPEVRAQLQELFALRAEYMFRVHARADSDGAMRFAGPIRSGRLRAPGTASMRNDPSKPLVVLPKDWSDGDDGIITFQAAELPLWQPVIFGTLAWEIAYIGRRQVAESAIAGLKEAGRNVGAKGHFKVFGRAKLTFLLAFEVAAYNIDRAKTFVRDQKLRQRLDAQHDNQPRRRAKRRKGTNAEALAAAEAAAESDRRTRAGPP